MPCEGSLVVAGASTLVAVLGALAVDARAADRAGADAGPVCVVAAPGAYVGDLLAELKALGFAWRRVSPAGIASMRSAPAVAFVVGAGDRPSAHARRACVALRAHPLLHDVPIVVIMPAGRVPIADPVLSAHELVVRPLRAGELLSRIGRASASAPARASLDPSLRAGALRLDPRSRSVWIGERLVAFSAREFELLDYLARHPLRVHSRAQLLRAVWNGDGEVGTRAVDVQVRRVRAKLGDECGHCIRTVRRVGYAFTAPS
jgi:DNA-binding response OmpR family regulator